MVIGLFPCPVVCGWCGYPVLVPLDPALWTRVVLTGHYQPLTLVGRWPLPVLFGPALGDPGWSMVPCPLGGLVEGLASLLWM